ncbi:gluconate 2-dehydrogenase [Arthrobacter sp. Hiyo6]|nr:gluconate 2-dehydrogenase [Arthrobacter sp. Hiyo6]
MTEEVDVLLVGVGAMGGLSAQVFAEAGLSVVGLEAGPFRPLDEFLPDELEHAYYTRGGLGPKFQQETPRWRETADEEDSREATFSLGRMVNGVGGSAGHYGPGCAASTPGSSPPRATTTPCTDPGPYPRTAPWLTGPSPTRTWNPSTPSLNT